MRAAILGAGGQLASDLVRAMTPWELLLYSRADMDICDFAYVREALSAVRPTVVINTAAFHRVDDCEDDPQRAFWVNTYAVRNLARVCAELDAVLVHFSTDYVFGGDRRVPYTEGDAPDPLNVYGVSKVAGEYFARHLCPRHFVIRSAGLFGAAGSRGKGGNFVETMIRLARSGQTIRVVDDQVMAPTYTHDLAQVVARLLETEAYGLYHVTNSGACSWYEFAVQIFALTGLRPPVEPTTSTAFGARAARPAFSVLAHQALRAVGIEEPRSWREALKAYLLECGHPLAEGPG